MTMPWSIAPITPTLGAKINDIKLNAAPSPEQIRDIKNALTRYRVLVFENQNFSAVQLRSFVAGFGPLFTHHSDEGVITCDGIKEVLQMVKEPDGTRLFGGSDWHADVTFRNPEGYVSVLHAKILPPLGGDTAFVSNIAAFSALSDGMKAMLRRLSAVHSYNGPGLPDHPTETAIHSVVRTDPESGEEGLYINKMFATRFDGMTEQESQPLILFLDRHMSRPEFSCRIRWQVGQIVMWDNRFTLHYPINDFTGHKRLLIRCTALTG